MKHLEELRQTVAYLSKLPINDDAAVDISHRESGVSVDIHRPSDKLAAIVVASKGKPDYTFVVPSGNVAVVWRKFQLFLSPAVFEELAANGMLQTHG